MITQSLRGLRNTGRLHCVRIARLPCLQWRLRLAQRPRRHAPAGDIEPPTRAPSSTANRIALNGSLPDPVNRPSPRRVQRVHRRHARRAVSAATRATPYGDERPVGERPCCERDMKVPHAEHAREERLLARPRRGASPASASHDGAFDNLVNFLALGVRFPGGDRSAGTSKRSFSPSRPSCGRQSGAASPCMQERDLLAAGAPRLALRRRRRAPATSWSGQVGRGATAGCTIRCRRRSCPIARPSRRFRRPTCALAGTGDELTWFGCPGVGPPHGHRSRSRCVPRPGRGRRGLDPGNPLSTPSTSRWATADYRRRSLAGGVPNRSATSRSETATTIRFMLPAAGRTELAVCDARAQRAGLVDEVQPARRTPHVGRRARQTLSPRAYFYR
jgi:hypothetical protein